VITKQHDSMRDRAKSNLNLPVLPHNEELERAVLSVLLVGSHAVAMHKVRQQVQHPLAFYNRDHRIIYLACLELDDRDQRIDGQTVADLLSRYDFKSMSERLRKQIELHESDELDGLSKDKLRSIYRRSLDEAEVGYEDSALANIGGYSAISSLTASFGPAAGLDRNIVVLWDYYLKRRMILRLQKLTDKIYRTPDDFTKLLDEGGQAILDLGRLNQGTNLHSIGSVVDETLNQIEFSRLNPNTGLRTGMTDLDHRLGPMRPGGLYVLAARPGAGKTSLALNMVSNIAGHGDGENRSGVLFFSLEVDRVDLVKKLLSSSAGIDFQNLENGILSPAEDEALTGAAKYFKDWQLDLMDVSDLTVNGLRSMVKRKKLEGPNWLKLVVIDYLQLLSSARSDASEYEKVSEISRVLKVLARELHVPVLALSQMSRDSEKGVSNQPREPRLSDLRGSGTIEQDADAVIFIHRMDANDEGKDGERRRMKIIIAKNRFGPTGHSLMDFYPAKMRFVAAEDTSSDYDAPSPRRARLDGPPTGDEDVLA
jgi:replicative DNA helicase